MTVLPERKKESFKILLGDVTKRLQGYLSLIQSEIEKININKTGKVILNDWYEFHARWNQIKVPENNNSSDLLEYLKTMVDKLKEVLTFVSQASEHIATASNQMSATSQQMSQGSQEQAASAEELGLGSSLAGLAGSSRWLCVCGACWPGEPAERSAQGRRRLLVRLPSARAAHGQALPRAQRRPDAGTTGGGSGGARKRAPSSTPAAGG